MPIQETIESPAIKAAKRLEDFYYTKEQENLRNLQAVEGQLREENLVNIFKNLNSQNFKEGIKREGKIYENLKDIIQQRYKDIEEEKFSKIADFLLLLNSKNIGKLEDLYKKSVTDLQIKNTELLNFIQETKKEISNELEISLKNLLENPLLIKEGKVRELIEDYVSKREHILNLSLNLFEVKIKELKEENKFLSKIPEKFNQKISKLEEAHKDIYEKIEKAMLASSSSGFGGLDTITLVSKTLKLKTTTITSDYPASSMDFMILGNATDGNINITLPPATNTGLLIHIKKSDSSSNTVTMTRGGSDTIENNTSIILRNQNDGRLLMADGSLTWRVVSAQGDMITAEVPSGSINGSNVTFTILDSPISGRETAYLNGARQKSGSGNDYTISGATITFATAPPTDSNLLVDYQKL